MQIQAAVIHIDRTDHRLFIVGHIRFGMDKARCILIDMNSRTEKFFIISTRHLKRVPFIRNMGQDQLHLHAALGRVCERLNHLIANNQIGRHDVDVLLGSIQHIQIDMLAHILIIERTVRIRNDVPRRLAAQDMGCQIWAIALRLFFSDIPHL